MVFKHLLLGLGGSVAVGGIGYGIYSSSQSSEKENVTDVGNSESPVDEGSAKPEREQAEKDSEQGEKTEQDGAEDTQKGQEQREEDGKTGSDLANPQLFSENTPSQTIVLPPESGTTGK